MKHAGVLAVIVLLAFDGVALLPASPAVAVQNPVRMSIYTDRYSYPLSGELVVFISITNLQANTLTSLSVNSSVFDSSDRMVMALPSIVGASIGRLSSATFNVSAPYTLADANYVIVSDASVNGSTVGVANVPLVVLDTSARAPLTLAMVFHMHQPIYMNLKGQFEQPWVQVHSGGDFQVNGTEYGSYYWQVLMLKNHPGVKVTFNLQPSLLYQWNATLRGFSYNGTFPSGAASVSYDIAGANASVLGYRALAKSGQAEILTSPFYHPLSALLVKFGWSGDLLAQIELGKNYTDSFMGVNATGMWTPEMGFTIPMVPIMQKAGIQYTVLDQANHFVGAKGPSANASIYQPFELEGANGTHIVAFFRDTQISNELTSVWNDIPNPRVAASEFMAAVANVYRSSPGGVLTLASDGENPLIANGVISALDWNAIWGAIESQSWLQTSTLGSVVAQHPPTAKLTSVPDGSWSGGFGLWIGVQPKTAIWQAIMKDRATLVNLTSQYGANNPEIKKLWNYLYIAEGSDWEWQTPQGPSWFAMQGYRYATAAAQYQAPSPPPAATSSFPLYAVAVVGVVAIVGVVLFLSRRRKP
jgi:alpha-amylase/alpha-mannosidase (GH57 family)